MSGSISDCLRFAQELAAVSSSPRIDVEVLLGHVIGCDRAYFYTWPEKELTEREWQSFHSLLARRINGEPIAYIVGYREFWSLQLEVNHSTLIPRADTEILVETALALLPNKARVIDLGTGTGAIALALAKERPQWDVVAVDFSAEAVSLASKNAVNNGISNIKLFESDWFSSVEGTFDLVISNPPYIEEGDKHLAQGDVRFEPLSALVSGLDGFRDIKKIISQAPKYLNKGGFIIVEHGWKQGEVLRACLRECGYDRVETRKDYGGNERATFGQWMK